MISIDKVVASLPTDIVDDLERASQATRLPIVRAGGAVDPDILVVGAQVATTLVTFAQIPQTAAYLAATLRKWRKGRAADSVKLQVRGPKGRVELELTAYTSSSELAAILGLVLEPEASRPDHGDDTSFP
jgi:hypothetical protein